MTSDHPTPAEEVERVRWRLDHPDLDPPPRQPGQDGTPARKPRRSNGPCRGCGATRDMCAVEAGVECCSGCSHSNPLASTY